MSSSLAAKILEGALMVHESNCEQMVKDPNGDYPLCKPSVGTSVCERCGGNILLAVGACPAVPPENRWSIHRVK